MRTHYRLGLLCITFLVAATILLTDYSLASSGKQHEQDHGINYQVAELLKKWNISENLIVVFISALPIVELRGAIPVAHLLFEMNPILAYLLAVLGNLIPVIPLLLFLGPASRLCMRVPIGKRFFEWFFERARRRGKNVEQYKTFGLAIFVAIPLPVTGAWTGCAIAFLMGISFHHALWAILLGVMISGGIMTAISIGITSLGWWSLAGAVAAALVYVLYRAVKPLEGPEEGEGAS